MCHSEGAVYYCIIILPTGKVFLRAVKKLPGGMYESIPASIDVRFLDAVYE
jgi:hypothetical protein